MNVWAEFQRILAADRKISRIVPGYKIITGILPDSVVNPDTNKTEELNAPYIGIMGPDSATPGGTSAGLSRVYKIQVSAYCETQAQAIKLRDRAAAILDSADLFLTNEKVFDISQGEGGIDSAANGLVKAFMRFDVETVLPRPNRKG